MNAADPGEAFGAHEAWINLLRSASDKALVNSISPWHISIGMYLKKNFDITTSNHAESLNAVFAKNRLRQLPVDQLLLGISQWNIKNYLKW
jgi:hypothetical protein